MVLSSLVTRVLVAGTGSIGRRHIANLSRLRPDIRWGLLRDGAREDEFSASLGARIFERLDDALGWRPDLAVIATPSSRHRELLSALLGADVPCFIEKPVVTEAIDVEALTHLAVSRALPPTQVGCVLRFLPSLRQVRRWLDQGRLGHVVRASFEVGQWLPDWRPTQDYRNSYSASRTRGGGVVLDLVHELDLACWFFGDARLVGAWGSKLSCLEIDTEDVALLALRTAIGAPVAVQLDYVSRRPMRRLHIVGDEGSIFWDLQARRCVLQRAGEAEITAEGFDTNLAYVDAMDDLLQAIEGDRPTVLPLAEGLKATRLAIEANARIRQEAIA